MNNYFLTTKEIAEILRMKYDPASRLIKREKLGHKIGKRVLVEREDFEKYLERTKQK